MANREESYVDIRELIKCCTRTVKFEESASITRRGGVTERILTHGCIGFHGEHPRSHVSCCGVRDTEKINNPDGEVCMPPCSLIHLEDATHYNAS